MRHYKRTTNRGRNSLEVMRRAAHLVMNERKSVQLVCREYDINRGTLYRFIARLKENPEVPRFGYASHRLVFNAAQESTLCEYLKTFTQIFSGLDSKDVRRLAYEYALKYGIRMPDRWRATKIAGTEWLANFLSRNTGLSITKTEVPGMSSMGRKTFFKKKIHEFFDRLEQMMDQDKFQAFQIWGVGRMEISSKIVTAERETGVKMLLAASASGASVPPLFVFPRKKSVKRLTECKRVENASGLIPDVELLLFLEHFISYVKPSKRSPVLLIVDSQRSHFSVPALDLVTGGGVLALPYPPRPLHCADKIRPLEVSVFQPFDKYLSTAHDAWLLNNPGKIISMFALPSIVRVALPRALTPNNITSGFQKTGIYPLDREACEDSAPLQAT